MSCNDFMGHFAACLTIDDPFKVCNTHSCLIEIMIDHRLEDDTKGKKILIEEECENN